MDALSEVLKIVKLRGALFFNAEFSAPWCLSSSQSSQAAPLLCPGAGHVIIYHYLTDGRAYAGLLHGSRRDLGPGDVVIFPHGEAHILGNGAGEPVDSLTMFNKHLSRRLKVEAGGPASGSGVAANWRGRGHGVCGGRRASSWPGVPRSTWKPHASK